MKRRLSTLAAVVAIFAISLAGTALAQQADAPKPSTPKKQASGMEHARVILTNPTHYAVALAYQPGVFDVPTVVARGADDDARHIRELAGRLGIPIFSNPPLARALYKVAVNRPIPREYFSVVAAVLSWLQRIELLNYSQVGMPSGTAGETA